MARLVYTVNLQFSTGQSDLKNEPRSLCPVGSDRPRFAGGIFSLRLFGIDRNKWSSRFFLRPISMIILRRNTNINNDRTHAQRWRTSDCSVNTRRRGLTGGAVDRVRSNTCDWSVVNRAFFRPDFPPLPPNTTGCLPLTMERNIASMLIWNCKRCEIESGRSPVARGK